MGKVFVRKQMRISLVCKLGDTEHGFIDYIAVRFDAVVRQAATPA